MCGGDGFESIWVFLCTVTVGTGLGIWGCVVDGLVIGLVTGDWKGFRRDRKRLVQVLDGLMEVLMVLVIGGQVREGRGMRGEIVRCTL